MGKIGIFIFLILSTISLGEEIHPEQNYLCSKGEKEIKYMISYRDVGQKVPCKVLEKYQGQAKYRQIAFSEKTSTICETALQKTLNRCESQGMVCVKRKDRN
jgi:hypothetical protein